MRTPAAVFVALFTAWTVSAEPRLVLHFKDAAGAPLPLEAKLRVDVAGEDPDQTIDVNGSDVAVELAPDTAAELTLLSERWWMPPLSVTGPDERTMRVWPLARVRGVAAIAEKDLALPKEVFAVVETPPLPGRRLEVPRGSRFACPVDGEGRWSCLVPEDRLDLAIRATGFVPQYRWDVDVRRDRVADLGTYVLKRGGSVLAWVATDSMQKLEGPARARLTRAAAAAPSETAMRLSVPVAEATVNARGAVQLAPVAAGTYVLTIEAKGFAPARVFPIEVYDGKESSLRRAIELAPPLTAGITLDPPLDPHGKPWQIELWRVNDFATGGESAPNTVQTTDGTGRAAIPDLTPGLFRLMASDSEGNGMLATELRITGPADAEQTFTIPITPVRGTITYREEPIQATLWFGGRDGAPRVRLTSSEEGTFTGALPRDGRWIVDVQTAELETTEEVEVGKDAIRIALSDREVAGWVVDARGERLGNVQVRLLAGQRSVAASTDGDGSFRFRAVPQSDVRLIARTRAGESSRAVELKLAEDERREGIELRIESTRAVRGRVLSRGTPVVGARIAASAAGVGVTPRVMAVSDGNGAFTLRVVEGARTLAISVAAPARTLQVFEVPVGDSELTLDVAAAGGTLVIAGRGPWRLRSGTVPVPMSDVLFWLDAQQEVARDPALLRIPNLAAGPYEVCTETAAPPRCASGIVPIGGELRLQLD